MRVTEKGQVTIPKPIRDRLGIGPGSEVEFRMDGDKASLIPVARPDVPSMDFRTWVESVRGTFDSEGMDGKAYIDWLRGPREDLDPD